MAGPERLPSFTFPPLAHAGSGTSRATEALNSGVVAATAVSMPPANFPANLVPPPLPERLRLNPTGQLPASDADVAAALAQAVPQAAAGAPSGLPSRAASLDAAAGLLQLPVSRPGRKQQRRRDEQQQQPGPKRTKPDTAASHPGTLENGVGSQQGGEQALGLDWQAALLAGSLAAAAFSMSPSEQPGSPFLAPSPDLGDGCTPTAAATATGAAGAALSDGLSGEAAVHRQLLLALLQALPEQGKQGAGAAVPPATPANHGGMQVHAATGGIAANGRLPLPPPLPPAPPHPWLSGSQPMSPTAAEGVPTEAEAAAHSLWAVAAAAPMPPLPAPPREVAEATAAARSGAPLSTQQRQAVFEHSVGVLVWMQQQLQHQAFMQSTAGAAQQRQLAVLQEWSQSVRSCLQQMRQQWRTLVGAMQAAVGDAVGQLQQQRGLLQAVATVQQQMAEQQQQLTAKLAQQQVEQAGQEGQEGPFAEAATPGLQQEMEKLSKAATGASQQAQQLKQENASLRQELTRLWGSQKDQAAVAQQLGAALMHERHQRQQLHGTVAELQARVEQAGAVGQQGSPAGEASAAAGEDPASLGGG